MKPIPIEPRGLGRELAARYVGISPTKFDALVKAGRMPKPKVIDARRVWDRVELDLAFESLPSDEPQASVWDEVLAGGSAPAIRATVRRPARAR